VSIHGGTSRLVSHTSTLWAAECVNAFPHVKKTMGDDAAPPPRGVPWAGRISARRRALPFPFLSPGLGPSRDRYHVARSILLLDSGAPRGGSIRCQPVLYSDVNHVLYFDVAVHDLSRQLAERSIVTAHSHCYRFTRVHTLTIYPAAQRWIFAAHNTAPGHDGYACAAQLLGKRWRPVPFLLAGAVGAASSRHRRRCQRNHTGWFEAICVVFRKRTAILREALVRARERGSVRLPRGNWSEQDGRRLSNCSCSSASAKSYFCFHNQEHETPLAFRNGTANNCELSLRVGRIQCSQMRGKTRIWTDLASCLNNGDPPVRKPKSGKACWSCKACKARLASSAYYGKVVWLSQSSFEVFWHDSLPPKICKSCKTREVV
jgi:hypothetical protein